MNSVNRIIRIADMFERKLRKIAENTGILEDPKEVVANVIFGSTPEDDQSYFLKVLNNEKSNFQKVAPSIGGSINIGGKVNVPQNMIEITVTCPQEKDVNLVNKLKSAVLADYIKAYGKSPQNRLKERKSRNTVQADAVAEHDAILTF